MINATVSLSAANGILSTALYLGELDEFRFAGASVVLTLISRKNASTAAYIRISFALEAHVVEENAVLTHPDFHVGRSELAGKLYFLMGREVTSVSIDSQCFTLNFSDLRLVIVNGVKNGFDSDLWDIEFEHVQNFGETRFNQAVACSDMIGSIFLRLIESGDVV